MIKIAKKRKKRKLKKKFVVLFLAIIVILIIYIMKISLDKVNNNSNMQKPSNPAELSQQDDITDEDVYEKYNCIKEKAELVDESTLQIQLKFERDLFGDNSNEYYFKKIIEELVKVYNRDFILKDTNKDITIKVTVNSQSNYTYTINNLENYYEQAKEKNELIEEYKKIEEVDKNITYYDFESFKINNWSIKGAGIKAKEKGNGYVKYKDYKILTENTFVNTIIINSDFEEEIIEGIKFGQEFNEIEKKLGKATFKENDMIGYKINDAYIFFYNDEIAIYPNTYFENIVLEDFITKYLNNEYSSIARFSYDIMSNCLDFTSYIDEKKSVILESPVRGIKIKITNEGTLSAEVYNNYNITEKTQKYIVEDIIGTNFEKDFVYEKELNRR